LKNHEKISRSIFRRLLPGLVLGFAILMVLLLLGDIRSVSAVVARFNWSIFPIVLLLTLVNYILRFIKWHYYLGQMNVSIAWPESLKIFVGGFPLAVTPGKAGEVVKAVWIQQRSALPVAKGVSIVVAERISDGLAVLLLSTLGVIAYPQYWPAFVFVFVILLGLVVVSQIRSLSLFILGVGERIPLLQRAIPTLRSFYEGSFSLFRPGAILFAVALGTISWLAEGIGFYLLLIGLGLPGGKTLFGAAVFILAFSTVIGAVSTLPGGLGAAELSIAGMLTVIVHPGAAVSSAATLLIRLATFWFSVVLGLGTWLLFPKLIGVSRREKRVES